MFSFSAHFHLPFVSNVSFNFFFLKYEKYLIKFRTIGLDIFSQNFVNPSFYGRCNNISCVVAFYKQ